jgi:uncharacterized GH25 family protein
MKKLFCLLGISLVSAFYVSAHETFIIPGDSSKDYKAGDTATLVGVSSHYFAVGEEIEASETVEMYVYKKGVKGATTPLEANRDRLWYEGRYRLGDDTPVVAVFRSIGGYYSILTDGSYADGNRRQALAANPATMSRNSRMTRRVLYKGQPWVNGEVKAMWDYYDYHTMDAWAQSGKTDAKGDVSFRLDHIDMKKPVLWIFQAGDVRKSSQSDVDEDNLKATLVFAVK